MTGMSKHYQTLILFIFSISTTCTANTYADFELGLVNDDNLTRSDYGYDKKSDTAIEAYANYGNFYDMKNNWGATASVFAQYVSYSKYTSFSSLLYGISASARKKLGLGPYSSSLRLSASFGIKNSQDNNRDSTTQDIGFGWSKRLNNQWQLAAGVNLDNTDAKAITYDTSGTTYYFSADYSINETLLLNLGVSQRKGDIISISNPSTNPNQSYLSLASSGKNMIDRVFGNNLTAYRINADTQILKIGLSYALNEKSSANISYENQNSKLPYGISYKNTILRANYAYSF